MFKTYIIEKIQKKNKIFQKNTCIFILCVILYYLFQQPGVAQLGARLTGGQEAVSSSLATRTKKSIDLVDAFLLFTSSLFTFH